MTADDELISLAAWFPHVASAIHNFVTANPAEISEQLLECGVIFTGSVWAIRRVSLCDLLGIAASQLKRLAKTTQWQLRKASSNYMDLLRRYFVEYRRLSPVPFSSHQPKHHNPIRSLSFKPSKGRTRATSSHQIMSRYRCIRSIRNKISGQWQELQRFLFLNRKHQRHCGWNWSL
jgi:hypothetical protein